MTEGRARRGTGEHTSAVGLDNIEEQTIFSTDKLQGKESNSLLFAKVRLAQKRVFKVAFIGDEGTGKSSIVQLLSNGKKEAQNEEIFSHDVSYENEKIKLKLFDNTRDENLVEVDMIVICFSIDDLQSFKNTKEIFFEQKIQNNAPFKPFIVVGTKSDTRNNNQLTSTLQKRFGRDTLISRDDALSLCKRITALKYTETSIHDKSSVLGIIDDILDILLENSSMRVRSSDIDKLRSKLARLPPSIPHWIKGLPDRDNAIQELVSTEIRYVQFLSFIKYIILNPLVSRFHLHPDLKEKIFSTFKGILSLSNELLQLLVTEHKHPEDSQYFGASFLKLIEKFSCYSIYCAHQESAEAELDKLIESDAVIREYISKVENLQIIEYDIKVPRKEILVRPFQRICRYEMLIKSIRNFTSKNHPDYQNLSLALEKITVIINKANNRKAVMDNLLRVQEIQSKFIHDYPKDLKNSCSVIIEGPCCVTSKRFGYKKKRYVFVLSNIIIFSKAVLSKYIHKYTLNNLSQLSLIDIPDDNSNNNGDHHEEKIRFTFMIEPQESHDIITFSFKVNEEKKKWWNALSTIIPDSKKIAAVSALPEKITLKPASNLANQKIENNNKVIINNNNKENPFSNLKHAIVKTAYSSLYTTNNILLNEGDEVIVLLKDKGGFWWQCDYNGTPVWVPSTHLEEL